METFDGFIKTGALSKLFLALFEEDQSTVRKYNADCYLSLNPPREMGDSHSICILGQ